MVISINYFQGRDKKFEDLVCFDTMLLTIELDNVLYYCKYSAALQ